MIVLRDLLPEDEEMIRNWRNLPDVAEHMYTDHHIAPKEHRMWFQGILNDPTRRYWIIALDQQSVGLVNLYDIDYGHKRCYWAFYVAGPDARGKGVGGFAEYSVLQYVFDRLHFNRLCCEVLASNHAVVEMHKRFGFAQEARFRQHVIKGGERVDVVSLAILREEWESRKPEIEEWLRRKGLLQRVSSKG